MLKTSDGVSNNAQMIYRDPPAREWSVSADGQRFLVNQPLHEEAPVPITIVTNWTERLKK